MKKVFLFSASILALTGNPSWAQNTPKAEPQQANAAEKNNQVFKLGQISVSVADTNVSNVGNMNTVTAQEIQAFTDTDTLDKAISLLPGVDLTDQIAAKNQKGVSIRGFTTRQISVLVDGVPTALPYDNDPDLQRYLTNDLSEVQVAKGISSVLTGPNTLGGVINMVTKKPTKKIEGSVTVRAKFDNDMNYSGIQNSVNIGTNQGLYYVQAGTTYNDIDHWNVSDNFTPTANQSNGKRNRSESSDKKANFKIGYTPNETDEYVIAYNYQHGKMYMPWYTTGTTSYRYYPYYDKQSVYALTHTAVGETGYVKSRWFYDSFSNRFNQYDDATYTTMKKNNSFMSDYEDYDFGGSVEAGADLIKDNTTKLALHYRRDKHTSQNLTKLDVNGLNQIRVHSKWEKEYDDTYSAALENTYHLSNATDIIIGASYDWLHSSEPKNNSKITNGYRKQDDSFNPMAAIRHKYSETGTVFGGIAKKSRFASMKERYSTRQKTYVVNPFLQSEKTVNYEIGMTDVFANKIKVETAVFYNDIDDALMAVVAPSDPTKFQVQNVGEARSYGFEFAGGYQITDAAYVGLGYSYLNKKLDNNVNHLKLTNVPHHKLNVYGEFGIIDGLKIVPVITAYSSRYSPTGGSPAESGALESSKAAKVGGFMTADLKIVYSPLKNLDIEVGAANIFDKNYELSEGYPSEGRNYFLTLSTKF